MPGKPHAIPWVHSAIPLLALILVGMLPACAGFVPPNPVSTLPSTHRATCLPSHDPLTPTAQATSPPPAPTASVVNALPSPMVVPSPTSPPIAIPEAPTQRTRYTLQATLDYANHSLQVEEQITFVNTTSEGLPSLPLIVEPRRYPGAFDLIALHWESGERATHYSWKDTLLTLGLPQPLPPGETLTFSISYALQLPYTPGLPKLRPYPFGYTEMQANLGDWYPFIPPYKEGTGWLVHEPGFYGEHLVYDVADFEVAIQLVGQQTDLVVAASAPATVSGEWLRYHHPQARGFAWSASPHYQVLTQAVELSPGRTSTVASYFFPLYEEPGEGVLRAMAQALPLYSRLFSPYTRPMLTAVQGDLIDGMEYDGMFFLSRDFYNWYNSGENNFLVALTAHETAHYWWYGLVGSDQALEPWLDEALCTYSESLYYEHVYPDVLDWWWTYRVDYYDPQGWVDMQIYDAPATVGQYRRYRDAVYLNGARFMQELRLLIGDQAFFGALRAYLARYAYSQATAAGFFEIVAQHSHQDLSPLLEKYFSNAPKPGDE